ncbi:hypothetical protein CALVIDRAFT_536116 [Calocera viscosa TUFC12733]|uniref:Uncharacterized protein n=1 Tax=Calocera viscosa (strain TUFC12733) TaxID=1330018 RepID=A0A167NB04_CALVF|nr:hypothetical protein CALVIDRAFT_536116 [Calocera viscosa TUFC12733]
MDELRSMVEQTDGYYARDWSLWLGWNNVRYIVETSLLHATLLNRTLIVPSHVYMRSCEYPHVACAAFATQVNRGDALGTDEWRQLPEEDQQGWMMPIGRMMDMDRLRGMGWNLVTGKEFALLEGLGPWELSNGSFPMHLPALSAQDNNNGTRSPLTIHHISNYAYEPKNTLRIDHPLPPPPVPPRGSKVVVQQTLDSLAPLLESLHAGQPIAWSEVDAYVRRDLGYGLKDPEVEMAVQWAGFARVWGLGTPHDMTKTVAAPSSYLVDPSRSASFTKEFGGLKARILHLEGEIHMGHPPGGLYFSTPQAANAFATMVVRDVRPVPEVEQLGERLAQRMSERVQGRMWFAAHMRRGDFVRYGWEKSQSLETHVERIRQHLRHGRQVLETIQMHGPAKRPRIGGFPSDESMWALDIPQPDDPFYLATDDRNATSLSVIHDFGGVLLSDLLTDVDRQELVGWPLLFTDVLSQVEQEIMARAASFYGSKLSSVSGGVLNMRVGKGRDPRTAAVN